MTSKLVVNTIEADTGISSVSFASSISMSSTSKFHFSNAGIDIGADTNINRPAAGVLGFNINSSEKARIDSSGRILIGTTTEGIHTADDLTIAAANGVTGITLRSGTGNAGNLYFSDGTSGDAEYRGYLQYYHGDDSMRIGTASNERVRITSDGNIGINVTPTNYSNYVTLALNDTTGSTIEGRVGGTLTGSFSVDSLVTINAVTSIPIVFKTANTERLRIDSNGNMGLGDTAPPNFTGYKSFSIHGSTGGALVFGDDGTDEWEIYGGDGVLKVYDRANTSERLRINSNGHMILSPGGYSLPTSDERMLNLVAWGNKPASIGLQRSNSLGGSTAGWTNELQSNGDLLWGVHNVGEKLRITPAGNVQLNNYSGSAGKGRISFGNSGPAFIEGYDSGNAGSGAYLRFQVNNTEKVRIPRDTWGLLVTNQGSTGNTGGYQTEGVSLRYSGDSTFVRTDSPPVTMTRKGNAGKILDFYNGTTYSGGIYINGSGNTAIQQTSDYRLKTDVSSMTDGIVKVKLLNPIYFKNNTGLDTTTTQNGFLAHEIQTVLPTLVDGEKDGDVDERGKGYQTMDYAGLTPTLTAAIKELIAKVETLEAEVAALKGS